MRRRLGILVLSALLSLAFGSSGFADPPKRGREKTEARARKKRAKARKDRKGPKKERREQKRQEDQAQPKTKPEEADTRAAQKAAQDAAQDAAQGADAQIVKEGETSVKVMTFSGLDIEGRLKSPQLLYFVSRVHAEFERPKLPHRSFMPELMRTSEREPLR